MLISIGFLVLITQVTSTFLGSRDICGASLFGDHWFVQTGNQGQLSATNKANSSSTSLGLPCSIKLTTCEDCHFEIDLDYVKTSSEKDCRKDFVRIQENGEPSPRNFCGHFAENKTYEFVSEAHEVTIDLLYTTLDGVGFNVYFEAVPNLYFITESTEGNNTGFIQSPFFPRSYPLQYSTEYFFSNSAPFGRILLLFSDFKIDPLSRLEVIDTNGSSMAVYSSETFRPAALLSSGSALAVKFSANGKSASGFRAQFFFRHASAGNYAAPEIPSTDCGGLFATFGGTITSQNLVRNNGTKAYDCIWIIKHPSYTHTVSHLSLQLVAFLNMAKGSQLEIRKGIYSTSPLLQLVTAENYHNLQQRMWGLSSETDGFYVRFEGLLSNNSAFALTYAAFDYWTCFGTLGSLCNNNRCIHRSLFCDGLDHCGDGSDEQPALCYATGLAAVQNGVWWRSQSPDYVASDVYTSRHLDLPLLFCCLALVAMLGTIGLVLCWIFKRKAKERRRATSRIVPAVATEIFYLEPTTADSPPTYDPPPSYEDIAKTLFRNVQLQAGAVTSTISNQEGPSSDKVNSTTDTL